MTDEQKCVTLLRQFMEQLNAEFGPGSRRMNRLERLLPKPHDAFGLTVEFGIMPAEKPAPKRTRVSRLTEREKEFLKFDARFVETMRQKTEEKC